MPIFLSCFSAGSAGSSPTSSQNATLPSSSAWPLSASGYSSSFSSIASAPSIAGTKHGLSTFTSFCILRKGPRKCFSSYCSSATIDRSIFFSPVLGRQLSWQLSVVSIGWYAWNCAKEKCIYSTWCHMLSLCVGIEISE